MEYILGQIWSTKVKVIRIWDSINNSTDKLISLDMILMDEHVIFNNFNIGFAKLIYA